MAPKILHRIINGTPEPTPRQSQRLAPKPAVLHGYTRHRVKDADYPGIIPSSNTPGAEAEASVLGTLVTGLTDADIRLLDLFEGDEYEKRLVSVRILREPGSGVGGREGGSVGKDVGERLKDVLEMAGAEIASEKGEEVEAWTYVYVAGDEELEEGTWDFETFKREKMAWWVEADEREIF